MSRACPLLGFVAELELRETLSESELQSVRDAFTTLIEQRGLECGESGTRTHWFRSIRSEASQATDADRQAVEEWASLHPAIARVRIGPVLDLDLAP